MQKPKIIFLSYKFTGEDLAQLTESLNKILLVLRAAGHTVYCSIEDEQWFKKNRMTNREKLKHFLDQLDKSDLILAFVSSDQKSEGTLIEIGYMIGKGKSFTLALKRGVKTIFLAEIANPFIEFSSVDDLCEKLTKTNF